MAARVEQLYTCVWDFGRLTAPLPTLDEVRTRAQAQLALVREQHKRRESPEEYKVARPPPLSPARSAPRWRLSPRRRAARPARGGAGRVMRGGAGGCRCGYPRHYLRRCTRCGGGRRRLPRPADALAAAGPAPAPPPCTGRARAVGGGGRGGGGRGRDGRGERGRVWAEYE